MPGFNALKGQHHVERRLEIDTRLEPLISASSLAPSIDEQLQRAGLTVTKWTSATSQRPTLQVYIMGGTSASGHVLYDVSVDYFLPLRVSLSRPPRVKKVGVFTDGTYGIARRARAGAIIADAVTATIDRFIRNAYLKANPQPARVSAPGWAPEDFVVDVKEAMTGYPRAQGTNLVVRVGSAAPVSHAEATEAALTFLGDKGLFVDTGSYFMSIYPQIAVFVNALKSADGLFAYTIRAEYRRNMDLPPEPNRIPLVRGAVMSSEGVGLGVAHIAKSDILDGIREHVGLVIAPHLEVNGIAPRVAGGAAISPSRAGPPASSGRAAVGATTPATTTRGLSTPPGSRPTQELRSTDRAGLMGANGQPAIVTGTVTSIERIHLNGDGMRLYLDGSKDVYVVIMPVIFDAVDKKLGGAAVVGKTITVRLNPLFLVGTGPIELAPVRPENIEVVKP